MKSRTNQRSEPAARSLRGKGWTRVDEPEQAHLVYYVDEEYRQYDEKHESRVWQYVSQFPSQYSFLEHDYLRYLGISSYTSTDDHEEESTTTRNHICRPILRRGQVFTVIVYWLVLSLDPPTVLYHDGYVYFDYSQDDENQFVTLKKNDQDGKKTNERMW
jgi:hypothetical protein